MRPRFMEGARMNRSRSILGREAVQCNPYEQETKAAYVLLSVLQQLRDE